MIKILDLAVTTKYAPKNIFPITINTKGDCTITKVKTKKRYEGSICITSFQSLRLYCEESPPKYVQMKIREFLINKLRAIPYKYYERLTLREKRRVGREVWGISTDNVVYNKWKGHTKEYHKKYWEDNKGKYRGQKTKQQNEK